MLRIRFCKFRDVLEELLLDRVNILLDVLDVVHELVVHSVEHLLESRALLWPCGE